MYYIYFFLLILVVLFFLTEFREVSIEHLQLVCHVNRGRLAFRTPGSVPIWICIMFCLLRPVFPNFVMFLDFEFRIPLATSILLFLSETEVHSVTFWGMTIYSDTLHWSDITPIFDPVIDLDLITEFDFLPNCERFPQNICNGCGMPTEDVYSSGHLVLSHFGPCKCINVDSNLSWIVLFPDFRVSNIPRYFCFAL